MKKLFTILSIVCVGHFASMAQCGPFDPDIGIAALAVQPATQFSCNTATIIAQWEIVSFADFDNSNFLATLGIAFPSAYEGSTGTISITSSDNVTYWEDEADFIFDDNQLQVDLLGNAVIPSGTVITIEVSNIEIRDDMNYTSNNLTASTQFLGRDCNDANDISTTQVSTTVSEVEATAAVDCDDQSAGVTANVSSGTAPFMYMWTGPGIDMTNEDQQSPTIENDLSNEGDYFVTITDANGCTVESMVTLNQQVCGVLPVEFTSFTGKTVDCQTQLNWSTATELNNDRFEVEHSTNAKDFTAITKVKGAGTTIETQQYSFLHQEVALGTNYYRLKQVDTDGTTDYSEMIAVDNTCEYEKDIFSIFPNPVGGEELTISYEVQQSHEAEIEVLDVSGKLILRNRIAAELGENQFSLSTAALAPGTYYISIYKEGRRVQTERLVKMTE